MARDRLIHGPVPYVPDERSRSQIALRGAVGCNNADALSRSCRFLRETPDVLRDFPLAALHYEQRSPRRIMPVAHARSFRTHALRRSRIHEAGIKPDFTDRFGEHLLRDKSGP